MRPLGRRLQRSAAHYGQLAFLTIDSAERIEWRDRYSQAARTIEAGAAPEDTGIPGVGTESRRMPDEISCGNQPWPRNDFRGRRRPTVRCLANSAHRSGQT